MLPACAVAARSRYAGRGDVFWDEVFLLKVNGAFLERCIVLTSEDALLGLSGTLHTLLSQCTRAVADANEIRVVHALETLVVLFKHIFRKKFANFGFDILNLCGGFERGDVVFRALTANVVALLNDRTRYGYSVSLCACTLTRVVCRELQHKSAAVALLSGLVTGLESINQNSLIEYLHRDTVFDALIGLASQLKEYPPANAGDALVVFQALFVSMALLNYQKYEASRNPFPARVAAIADAHTNQMLCAVMTDVLAQVSPAAENFFSPPLICVLSPTPRHSAACLRKTSRLRPRGRHRASSPKSPGFGARPRHSRRSWCWRLSSCARGRVPCCWHSTSWRTSTRTLCCARSLRATAWRGIGWTHASSGRPRRPLLLRYHKWRRRREALAHLATAAQGGGFAARVGAVGLGFVPFGQG